jgi:hypothetical protein
MMEGSEYSFTPRAIKQPSVKTTDSVRLAENGSPIEDSLATVKLRQARETLIKYLPTALPQEPTTLVIDNGDSFNGEYVGKLRGINYVALETPLRREGEDIAWETESTIAVVHELIHQKHHEIMGPNFDIDQYVSDEVIKGKSAEEIVYILQHPLPRRGEERVALHIPPETKSRFHYKSLAPLVSEGIAVLGELYVVHKMMRDPEIASDPEKLKALQEYRKRRLGHIAEIRDTNSIEGIAYYEGPFKLIKALYQKFGLEKMSGVIGSIDVLACNKILRDSEEFRKILENPMLLPGISNYTSSDGLEISSK